MKRQKMELAGIEPATFEFKDQVLLVKPKGSVRNDNLLSREEKVWQRGFSVALQELGHAERVSTHNNADLQLQQIHLCRTPDHGCLRS